LGRDRFPFIVVAAEALAVHSCLIDGEVIARDRNGTGADRPAASGRFRHSDKRIFSFAANDAKDALLSE
jgi:ATP-dependent DNA ligase